jgi:hypothetical protein
MGTGHTSDANTLGLWRFDDSTADVSLPTTYSDNNVVVWSMPEGTPGIVNYDPIPGQYARAFRSATTASDGNGHSMTRASDVSQRGNWTSNWTVEAFVRWEGNRAVIIAHGGTGTGAASTQNIIGAVAITSTGLLQVQHQNGANVSTFSTSVLGQMTLGQWHYVAVVKNATAKTYSFYIDGAFKDSIAYVNEATDGASGAWQIGRAVSSGTSGFRSTMSLRAVSFRGVAKNQAWIDATWALFATTGLLQTSADPGFYVVYVHFTTAPQNVDSGPLGLHLTRVNTAAATEGSEPGSLGLIADGGRARYVHKAALGCVWDQRIVDALKNNFTLEMWIVRLPHPLGAADASRRWGLFCHGDPGVETQPDNYFAAHIGPQGFITMDCENGLGINSFVAAPNGSSEVGRREHIALRKTYVTATTWTAAIFVNGVKVYESAAGAVANYDGGDNIEGGICFQLGTGQTATGSRHAFIIDDTRLSKIARSDSEILASYNAGALGASTATTDTVISPDVDEAPGSAGAFSADYATAKTTPIVMEFGAGSAFEVVVGTYPDNSKSSGRSDEFVIYRDGAFRQGFAAASFTSTVGGLKRLHIIPDGGWPSSTALHDIQITANART